MNCKGCKIEIRECYKMQQQGYDAGLEFYKGHTYFFALDKGKWIVPFEIEEK